MIYLAKYGNGPVVTTPLIQHISLGAVLRVNITVSLWLIKWFSEEVLPTLQKAIRELLIVISSQPMHVGK